MLTKGPHVQPAARKWLLRLAETGLLIAAFSCAQYPESYAPPEQKEPLTVEDLDEPLTFVPMNDPMAEECFVQDIRGLEAGSWRWTGQRPTLSLELADTQDWDFVADFSLPGAVLEQTGPVTISFKVNGRVLDTVRYEKDGEYHYAKAVDETLLKAGAANTVSMELDKVYVSPRDGVKLGIILSRAGFVKR